MRRALRKIIVCAVCGALGFTAAPAAPPDVQDAIETGRSELRAAAAGREGAAGRALAAFESALAADPASAHARAGRGLALSALALEAPMAKKLALAQEACAELDAAVAATPGDAAVRLMRATHAVQMPLLLERRSVAESDFVRLLAVARDRQASIAPPVRRGIFFQAAAFALKERRTGAIDLLEEAASVAASEPTDEQIQSMLAIARRLITSPSHADRVPPEEAPASRP